MKWRHSRTTLEDAVAPKAARVTRKTAVGSHRRAGASEEEKITWADAAAQESIPVKPASRSREKNMEGESRLLPP
jgi:hypothetical protein